LANLIENGWVMTLKPFALATLILLAGCNKPAGPSATTPDAAPTGATAAATPGADSSSPSQPPDLSGQPVTGTVASAEGAATTDPKAPAPRPAVPAK